VRPLRAPAEARPSAGRGPTPDPDDGQFDSASAVEQELQLGLQDRELAGDVEVGRVLEALQKAL
jgi:hypothetical protein